RMEDGMFQPKLVFMTVSLFAILVAGCQSQRFARLEPRSPAPLPAAPAGSVTASQLPPPSGATASDFPAAPGQETQMADIDDGASASAPELTPASVAGVWTVSIEGQTCRVATPQTKFGEGFRAASLKCPPPLDTMRSWSVSDKQLTFHDETGAVLARLYSSGEQA